jgi:hypothetical protein
MVSSLVRVNKEFMNEFEQRFFERLSNDELLDKLVVENEVDLENVLTTYVDDTWGYHSICVSHELLKHFLKDDTVSVDSIHMKIINYIDPDSLEVDCEIKFSYRVSFPAAIDIDDNVVFRYKDEFGRTCSNEIVNGTSTRRMKSTFKLFTVNELVDVLFEILGQLLKEENK